MMVGVYTASGGLSTAEDVEKMLRQCIDQPISTLAKWIVRRSIVILQWRMKTFLPLFQFDLRDMSLRPEPSAVVRELTSAFDDWELACWFSEPNSWLRGERPVERIGVDFAEVLMAARADRFVALG